MPDEPRPSNEPEKSDEELERELSEFEAELFKAAEESKVLRREVREEGLRVEDRGPASEPGVLSQDEIEARLAKAIQEADAYLGPVRSGPDSLEEEGEPVESAAERMSRFHEEHPDLHGRLEELDRRAKLASTANREKERQKQMFGKSEGDSARGLGVGLSAAYTIIGGPLGGALIGFLIDKNAGTTYWTGICVMIGAFGGMALGLMIISRSNLRG